MQFHFKHKIFTKKLLFCSFFIAASFSLCAQLCQGSLGDPLIKTTFGSGTNPGPALGAAVTNYGFTFSDCPQDGNYTLRSNTTACFGNTWHTVNADHTGDANGYFMLVNASTLPGDFYVDTVRGLCSNTTFEFASWIMNVLRPEACGGAGNQPNITFSIETLGGNLLGQYNTGNIAAAPIPAWKQYGFFFTMPAGVNEVVVRMKNNAPGGCGNDLLLDDITFRPCGPQLNVLINGSPETTADICRGTEKTFTFSTTIPAAYTNPLLQWQQSVDNGNSWTDIAGANSMTCPKLLLHLRLRVIIYTEQQ